MATRNSTRTRDEFLVRPDGLMTERAAQEVARWYSSTHDQQPDDQETFEAHLMFLRTRMTLAGLAERGRRTGLSSERYNVLRTLYQSPERRLTMTEIVSGLNVSPTSITKLVDGLSDSGLVRRAEDAEDKRRVLVELTGLGVETVERALPLARAATRRLWAGLTGREKRVLVHLLAKLRLSLISASDESLLEDDA